MNLRPAPTETDKGRSPDLALVVVILVWGSGPVMVKLISVTPILGVGLRFAITVPVVFAILHLRGGRVSRETLRRAALPGIAFGINLMFVFAAVQEATIAVLAVATTLQPVLVLIVAGPLFGERPTRAHLMWTLVGICGAAGVVLGAGSELRSSPLGLVYALLSVTTFTSYFVASRWERSTTQVDPVEWMAAINTWALLSVILPILIFVDRSDFGTVDARDWLWLVVLAYVSGVFGHILMAWIHGYVPAARSALAILAMNIVAVLLAWPVHDEPVTWVQGVAGLFVLAAVTSVLRTPTRPVVLDRELV
jgi:drug/metabolite transporter (DMT)-like permease